MQTPALCRVWRLPPNFMCQSFSVNCPNSKDLGEEGRGARGWFLKGRAKRVGFPIFKNNAEKHSCKLDGSSAICQMISKIIVCLKGTPGSVQDIFLRYEETKHGT